MVLTPAITDALALLERASSGPIGKRIAALGSSIVARELALVAPSGEREHGPIDAHSGSADLVYRDEQHIGGAWFATSWPQSCGLNIGSAETSPRYVQASRTEASNTRPISDNP